MREARRRAGLTQRELALRLGTTQSAVARLERGGEDPSYQRVIEAVRACGIELVPRLQDSDDSTWSIAWQNLHLSRDQRVRKHAAAVRFIRDGRRALARARA